MPRWKKLRQIVKIPEANIQTKISQIPGGMIQVQAKMSIKNFLFSPIFKIFEHVQ